jgi:hypothetical protein
MTGRPCELTEARLSEIKENIEAGASWITATQAATGVTERCCKLWKAKGRKEYKAAIKAAEESGDFDISGSIMACFFHGVTRGKAIAKMANQKKLHREHPEFWSRRMDPPKVALAPLVEVNGRGAKIKIKRAAMAQLSEEELLERLRGIG